MTAQEDLQPSDAPEGGARSTRAATDELQALPLPELQQRLDSSPAGLSDSAAQTRLEQYGPNELARKKTNAFIRFLGYFWGPIQIGRAHV